jgi:hypothetical protein
MIFQSTIKAINTIRNNGRETAYLLLSVSEQANHPKLAGAGDVALHI